MEVVSKAASTSKVVVVSNREPVIHELTARGIKAVRPASGLVTGLEPIVRAVHGTWVAHGSGPADRHVVDNHDRVGVPSEHPEYVLRRVWLTRREEDGYYYGLSNNALWPLSHIAYTRPVFCRDDWEQYEAVNEKFCDAVLDEVGEDRAMVFIQDYHLGLLPRMLKNRRPDLTIAQFWHIPWPNREAFRIFPWAEELLDGLLGNDLLGFHVQYHCNNFLDTVDRGIEAKVDYEHFRVFRGGHPTTVRPFPISVDFHQIEHDSDASGVACRLKELQAEFAQTPLKQQFIVGVDRIDYTKGILERLRGFDLLLQRHPELKGHVTFLNFSAPSRTHVEAYRELNDKIDDLVDDINWRHQTEQWVPVQFLRAHHDYSTVLAAYRLADVLMVTSLHDGMNLVAKEFVASRSDELGSLILSRYTGAARELKDALLVNPYDTDGLADRLNQALTMPESDRIQRMQRLRQVVAQGDIYHWGTRIFQEVLQLHRGGE
ncbi:trehalose-6-phosphate synthase [candidate division GN15 bacterium]|uniref:Trehalose-6-phosphate synthase n=1 Tax=candidate division GN15 bacterium TaxID=2072418 RepID=A0A855X4F9_9BACT|nr:MAG: trehalose-6-phosphate synthase [candidate division GN15 bacterium]